MKKKILAGILAVIVTASTVVMPTNDDSLLSENSIESASFSDSKYKYVTDNDFEYKINYDGKTAEITSYKGTSSYIKYPAYIGKYKVNKISNNNISSDYIKKNAKKVYIPEGIQTISNNAFSKFEVLEEVQLPDSLKVINSKAFFECSKLNKINLPKNLLTIGDSAFSQCNSLTSVKIPESVVNVGERAFSECQSLKSISIPGSIGSIPGYCCAYCNSLENIVIGKGITEIGREAFDSCINLKKISLPSTVKTFSSSVFYKCSSLTSVHLPDSMKKISNFTFALCNNLKSINLPKNITHIGENAFKSCINLTNIKLSANIKYISKYAFDDCSRLKSITIPIGIKSIENRAMGYYASDKLQKTKNFTIKGYNGTAAQTYARKNGFKFINLQRKISKAKFKLNKNGLITVKYGKQLLKKNSDYTIAGRHNTKTGKYTITAKGKGLYTGIVKKSFTIKPSTQRITKVKKLKKAVKVYYRKNSSATGYKIQLASNKKLKKARTYKLSRKYFAKTIKNLKSGKLYYVRVRSYKVMGRHVYYGNWSKVKAVRAK